VRTLVFMCLGLIGFVIPCSAQERLTQADLLRRVIDLERLATPPAADERTGMFSSFDRRSRIDADGKYVDWDANSDRGQFLGKDEEGWDIMADMAGPGAITRIWSANPHGDIRIILDGELVIDTDFRRLLSGQMAPFEEPLVYRGLNCYFPIGFARSCRVVCRDSTAYYQINVVQYALNMQVDRFTLKLDQAAQQAVEEVKQALEEGLSDKQLLGSRRPLLVAVHEELGPGEVLREALEDAGTVRALYVALTRRADPRALYALHRCILRITVDGEESPCVEAPLIDFFGSGFDLVPFNSLPIGTNKTLRMPLPERRSGDDRFMYCQFPMPFRDGLRIEIENLNEGREKIGLFVYMQVDTEPPPADALRFHAGYRKEDPCQVLDYTILQATGRGRIVGCLLNVDCPRATWWGEGDDKLWIDGDVFPSYFGTGSEDYLGDAWGLHQHIRPLQGVTRTAPYGKNSAYRWHIHDCINFHRSARFTIENWQDKKTKDTYYSTVAYWYAEPGCQRTFEPLTLDDVTPPGLRIPGAIEIEQTILTTDGGSVVREKHAGGAELSGGRAINITTTEPVRIAIPSDQNRTVRLKLRVNPRRSFETITVTGTDGRTIGTVNYERTPDGIYTVGVIRLNKSNNPVNVQCSRSAMLDCWIFEPLPRNPRGPEGEDLEVLNADGVQTEIAYATLPWSAGAQRSLTFTSVGQTAMLALPYGRDDAAVVVRLHVTCGEDGGTFQTLIDGNPLGVPIDCHSAKPELKRVALGAVRLTKGQHTLGFKALETESAAQGMRLGLDVIELVRALSQYAIECEDIPFAGSKDNPHGPQAIGGCGGDEHVFCRPTTPGAWVEFEVPLPRAGRYKLRVVCLRSFDYGIVQAYVNGQAVGTPTDTFAKEVTPGTIIDLGVHELGEGPLRLKVEVVDKNEQSTGHFFGVDCVILEPAGD